MCATQTSVQHIIHSILSKLPSDCSVGEEFEEIKVSGYKYELSVISSKEGKRKNFNNRK